MFNLSRKRLVERLIQLFRDNPGHEFTAQHLFLRTQPRSPEELAVALDELTKRGLIRRIYRVESPVSHGGIQDFGSLAEIPTRLHDWTVDEEIEVVPDTVKPIFTTM